MPHKGSRDVDAGSYRDKSHPSRACLLQDTSFRRQRYTNEASRKKKMAFTREVAQLYCYCVVAFGPHDLCPSKGNTTAISPPPPRSEIYRPNRALASVTIKELYTPNSECLTCIRDRDITRRTRPLWRRCPIVCPSSGKPIAVNVKPVETQSDMYKNNRELDYPWYQPSAQLLILVSTLFSATDHNTFRILLELCFCIVSLQDVPGYIGIRQHENSNDKAPNYILVFVSPVLRLQRYQGHIFYCNREYHRARKKHQQNPQKASLQRPDNSALVHTEDSPVYGAGIELGGQSRSPRSSALLTTQRNPSFEHARSAASARRSATTSAGGSRRNAFPHPIRVSKPTRRHTTRFSGKATDLHSGRKSATFTTMLTGRTGQRHNENSNAGSPCSYGEGYGRFLGHDDHFTDGMRSSNSKSIPCVFGES